MRETVLPGVIDRHVHLGLVHAEALRATQVVEVHDLGWDPAAIAGVARRLHPDVRVRYAGPFHTAVGGYPSGRSWAPDAAIREVRGAGDARAAVGDARSAGAFAVKIALNAELPLLDDETLAALIGAAHDAGLPALVHAEGAGQAHRAIAAGADALVHTPWTEHLPLEVVADAVARGMRWISTLAIHEGHAQGIAVDNARRFVDLGGHLLYGTDLGNGPSPIGVNETEILLLGECGLRGDALLRAVFGAVGATPPAIALAGDGPQPRTAVELVAWLRSARRINSIEPVSIEPVSTTPVSTTPVSITPKETR